MKHILNKIKKIGFLIFIFSTLNSCILDEFKVDEIRMKEDWNMDIVSPLFHGKFEFKDLVGKCDSLVFIDEEQTSILNFPNDSLLIIPSRIVFEPATIIHDFNFLVDGKYSLSSVRLEYTVSNGCPFPLNFQMQFRDKRNMEQTVPVVLPPPFLSAIFDGENFIPVETKHSLSFNVQQVYSFSLSNRIDFTTWFDSNEWLNSMDTFLTNYPVEISVILYGELQRENEN